MLDRFPPLVQHFILLFAPVAVAFASTDLVPLLRDVNPFAASFAAIVLTQLGLLLTKLTAQYGVGSDDGTGL